MNAPRRTPRLIHIASLCAGLLLAPPVLWAQGQQSPQQGQGGGERAHRGPPPEAIAACKSKAMNDSCSFTSPHGAETGTCWQPDASKPLACRPAKGAGPSGGPGQGQGQGQGQGKPQTPAQK